MIIDKEMLLSNAQALTATAASTNIYDASAAGRDLGIGDNPTLKIRLSVGTAFASTGSSTLIIAFQGSTDNSTYDTYYSTGAIAKATLAANAIIDMEWPRVLVGFTRPRYYRLYYTVGVADFTAGTLTAAVVLDRDSNIAYAAGVYVSN